MNTVIEMEINESRIAAARLISNYALRHPDLMQDCIVIVIDEVSRSDLERIKMRFMKSIKTNYTRENLRN